MGTVVEFKPRTPKPVDDVSDLDIFTTEISSEVMAMIADEGVDVDVAYADKDLAFMHETIKSYVCKLIGEEHPMQALAESMCVFPEDMEDQPEQ